MRVKNNSGNIKIWAGQELADQQEYDVQKAELIAWQTSDAVVTDLTSGDLLIGDTIAYKVAGAEAVAFLFDTDTTPKDATGSPFQTTLPFASKILSNGKKLFRRIKSTEDTIDAASVNIDYVVSLTSCKITGVQILNGKLGDKVTFQVLDTAAGTVSGTPYAVLNEFGTDVYIIPDIATYPSKYDADLFVGLTLRIIYVPKDHSTPYDVYVNFDLHEVTD